MSRQIISASTFLLGWLIYTSPISANTTQAIGRNIATVHRTEGMQASGLGAVVAFDLNAATIESALLTIGRQADLKVTLSPEVRALDKRVTLRVSGMTAEQAFKT